MNWHRYYIPSIIYLLLLLFTSINILSIHHYRTFHSKKIAKIVAIFTLSISLTYFTYILCYTLAEKYFFDKFFYQKSISHGYGLQTNKQLSLESFGDRSKDMVNLLSNNPNILGAIDNNNVYKVAIIGDSYAWGMGLKYSQTVSQIISKKLNTHRPTLIYNYSEPGNSILEYYANINKTQKFNYIDLYVVLMVANDIAFNKESRFPNNDYQNILSDCQIKNKENPLVYWFNWQEYNKNNPNSSFQDISHEIENNTNKSWSSSSNLCVLDTISKLFPHNTIFLITDDYEDSGNRKFFNIYKNALEKYHHKVISSESQKYNPQYSKYWTSGNVWSYFRISENEIHPSALAHQMCADTIYNEITANPEWNFKQ